MKIEIGQIMEVVGGPGADGVILVHIIGGPEDGSTIWLQPAAMNEEPAPNTEACNAGAKTK